MTNTLKKVSVLLLAFVVAFSFMFTALSENSYAASKKKIKKPAKVKLISVKTSNDTAQLTWNYNSKYSGYQIYMNNGTGWKKAATLNKKTAKRWWWYGTSSKKSTKNLMEYEYPNQFKTPYYSETTKLKENTTYKFKVRAFNKKKIKGKVKYKYGKFSKIITVKTKSEAKAKKRALKALNEYAKKENPNVKTITENPYLSECAKAWITDDAGMHVKNGNPSDPAWTQAQLDLMHKRRNDAEAKVLKDLNLDPEDYWIDEAYWYTFKYLTAKKVLNTACLDVTTLQKFEFGKLSEVGIAYQSGRLSMVYVIKY